MKSHIGVTLLVTGLVTAFAGCTTRDAPPGPGGPTLSLSGASGISADVRRSVTEVTPAGEQVIAALDTAVWAPFNEFGAASPPSTAGGLPGSVGWLSKPVFEQGGWTRHASFVDSAGVLHELFVEAADAGPPTQVEYRKADRLALRLGARWKSVPGGWVLVTQTATYQPDGSPVIRVDVNARQMSVAHRAPAADVLLALGGRVIGGLRPRPLAAQFFFQECPTQWLKWAGAALLAEVAWVKFAKTKSYKDYQVAMAATTAAGVALDGLVDCMLVQGEKPTP